MSEYKELSYESVKEFISDADFAVGQLEDGRPVVYGSDSICDEVVYTASFMTKSTKRGEWWVKIVYHEDGTTEELYSLDNLE